MDERTPEIRLSDADRDAAVGRLATAMADGRLEVAEYEERSRLVYEARVASDLTPLLADLPPVNLPAPATGNEPVAGGAPRRWLVSLFGDIRRSGRWSTGEKTIGLALFGDTKLDLTDLDQDAVDILVVSIFGDVVVTVTPTAVVDAGGFAVFGEYSDRVEPAAGDAAMRVRVRRFSLFGDLKLRSG